MILSFQYALGRNPVQCCRDWASIAGSNPGKAFHDQAHRAPTTRDRSVMCSRRSLEFIFNGAAQIVIETEMVSGRDRMTLPLGGGYEPHRDQKPGIGI